LKNNDILNNIAVRASSGYFISSIIIKSLSLFTAPVFTRLLSPADYGIVSNFLANANILSLFVGLGLSYSIANARIDFPKKLIQFIASITIISFIAGILVVLFSVILKNHLSELFDLSSVMVVYMTVYVLFIPPLTNMQQYYRHTFKYKQNIRISIFIAISSVILCVVLILFVFEDVRYLGRIVGLTFPSLFLGIIFFINILIKGRDARVKDFSQYAFKIGLPMIPHSLGMVLITQIDRIMIFKMAGGESAGLYSFGASYAILITLITSAAMQSYQPILYDKLKIKSYKSIEDINVSIMYLFFGMVLLLIGLAPEALKILGEKSFYRSIIVVPTLALGFAFQFLYYTYSMILGYHKKTQIIAIGTIITGIINVIINFLLIPQYGYWGASIATLTSYMFLSIYSYYMSKRVANRTVYNTKKLLYALISIHIAAYGLYVTYDFILIRMIILTSICLLLYFYISTYILKNKNTTSL